MKRLQNIRLPISSNLYCFILIFLCFTLTSAGWISWNYHLITMIAPETADILCMVAGYGLQAVGIGAAAFLATRIRFSSAVFTGIIILYLLCLLPATLSSFPAACITFGLLTNFLCGCMAERYLLPLAQEIEKNRRGLIFGGSYAASTIAVWVLSLFHKQNFLKSPYILIVYILLGGLIILLLYVKSSKRSGGNTSDLMKAERLSSLLKKPETGKLLLMGAATIILLSMVKNIGFSFPSADLQSGINLELSRIFYGTGLLIAGIIHDKSRKLGAILTLAALIIPFISLALSQQPVPGMVFWALDYFFFGFFSVFRVLFLADLAAETGCLLLAGSGLLLGRLGDAVGTAVSTALTGQTILLVIIASVLFIGTVILFFQFYQKAFPAGDFAPLPSEEEQFEQFSTRYGFSVREREVLKLVLQEQSNAEIAAALFVSESTVKFHIHNILKKTACRNRSELKSLYQ